MLDTARSLNRLLESMEITHTYDNKVQLAEMKRLHMMLAPVYESLFGHTILITTSYPVHVWFSRAKEQASDALAFLEANPGWIPSRSGPAPSEARLDSEAAGEPVAFLVMPFNPEFEWLRDEIMGAGADVGVKVERADDIFRAGIVIDQVKERIRSVDAVVGVCTGRNPNVFYELGIAEEAHRPILVAETSDDLPFDIQHFRAQFYGASSGQSRETLRQRIASALRETIDERRGAVVASQPPAKPQLTGYVRQASRHTYLLEIENDGDVPLYAVSWDIPESAQWHILENELPSYPIEEIHPGDVAQVPLFLYDTAGPSAQITLRASTRDGESYERTQLLSIRE